MLNFMLLLYAKLFGYILCNYVFKVGGYNVKTGLDIDTSSIQYPTEDVLISRCPNEQECQSCFETSDSRYMYYSPPIRLHITRL